MSTIQVMIIALVVSLILYTIFSFIIINQNKKRKSNIGARIIFDSNEKQNEVAVNTLFKATIEPDDISLIYGKCNSEYDWSDVISTLLKKEIMVIPVIKI